MAISSLLASHEGEYSGILKSVVNVIKLFLEENLTSPKLRNLKKFVLMSEPAQKCSNNAIFKKNYSLKLLLLLKWPILAVLAYGEI